MAVALTAINTGIYGTFVSDLVFPPSLVAELDHMTFQNFDDLTEAVTNTPTMQFFWEGMDIVSSAGETDRHTFGGGERIKDFNFRVDLYIDRSSSLHKLFGHMLPLTDAINDVFEAQNQKPYFGIDGIKSYSFSCERALVEYGGYTYPVVQWELGIRVF